MGPIKDQTHKKKCDRYIYSMMIHYVMGKQKQKVDGYE